MAPFIEGDRVITEGELLEIKKVHWGNIEQSLSVFVHDEYLAVRIYETITSELGTINHCGDIKLEPKEGISVGERKIEWKEE